MNDCLIWIADDDKEDLDLIEQAFNECSFKVRIFDAEESRNIVSVLLNTEQKRLPQLILLDINMPVISGKELLQLIKKHHRLKHIPIAIFTTSNSKREKLECLELGANCFLTKPYDFRSMIKICSALSTVFCTAEFDGRKSYLSVL